MIKTRKKKTLLTLLGLLIIIPVIFGIKLYSIVHNPNIPFRDILDGYNYIYTDVKCNDSIYTVVMEGASLYAHLRHYMFQDKYSEVRYMFDIDYALRHNKPIEINDSLLYLIGCNVDKELCKKYSDLNYIKNECMNPYGCIRYDLDSTDNVCTMIYVLLKNNITCSRDCETGCTHVLWDDKKK